MSIIAKAPGGAQNDHTIEIRLDGFDLLEAAMKAERYESFNRGSRALDHITETGMSSFEIHYLGAMGEVAVAKHYGVPICRELTRGGDNGIDVVINGWNCHIKTFSFGGPKPDFIISNMKEFTAPVGIGARRISPTRVLITGCITKPIFQKVAFTSSYGYGDRLAVKEADLVSIDELLFPTPGPGISKPEDQVAELLL